MPAENSEQTSVLQRLRKKRWLCLLLQAVLAALFLLLQTWQIEASCFDKSARFPQLPFDRLLLNMAILLAVDLAAKLLLQRWPWAMFLGALLATIWSFVNFFVLKYHGSPLFFSEFRNFGTAMDVIDGYSFAWEAQLSRLLLFGVLQAVCGLLTLLIQGRDRFFRLRRLLWNAAALAVYCGILALFLFVLEVPKPRKTIGWTWRQGVDRYGYTASIVEDVDRALHAFEMPEGYDPAHLDALEPVPVQEPAVRPDLILIVNESFCDMRETLEYTTDTDYMEGFVGQSGAINGKVVITSVGGSTNNTEYELLTSNSLHLLTRASPFNYLNLQKDSKNIVSYLKPLGYSSLALHCGSKSNYSRNRAYPDLGFDRVLMGEEAFTFRKNGNRAWLDSDLYQDLIRYYNEMDEGPRLVYALTFQNHGGYESNDPELDTVHVQEDFGDYTDDLNEYLSSVRLSCQAFAELVDSFRSVDRPVMILMLGDHAPTLVNHIPLSYDTDEADTEIRKRTVPFALWANYPVDFPSDMETVTLTDLVPLLLKTAGLPLSRYHEQLLALHDVMPERTLNGFYRDSEGRLGQLYEDCPWADLLQIYYEMEYNALKGGSDYRRELFELPAED